MTIPIFIELSQQCKIERRVDAPWEYETNTVYEPTWVNAGNIETMSYAGLSRVRMISGEIIWVRETPAEIIEKLAGHPARGGK
ncbi:hypothetical protein V6L80_00860 [Erwinia persicina]|uniref:hypothetical protein n=1 Tax=Erwinia persicina TaxID=55211 RepID=UPI0030D1FFCE